MVMYVKIIMSGLFNKTRNKGFFKHLTTAESSKNQKSPKLVFRIRIFSPCLFCIFGKQDENLQ